MTSFVRFFLLALPLELGATTFVGPAFFLGVVGLLLMVTAQTVEAQASSWSSGARFWTVLVAGVVLTSLVDGLTGWLLPDLRASWGVYLNLLAFSPLVLRSPENEPLTRGAAALLGLKTGVLLILLLTGTALVREPWGHGTITLVPSIASWPFPGLSRIPQTLMTTGAGAFFLAAVLIVAYRALRPRIKAGSFVNAFWEAIPPAVSAAPVRPATPATPPPRPAHEPARSTIAPPRHEVPRVAAPRELPAEPEPSPTDEWGETLEGVVASLGPGETKRLLVIGCGNGELAYYLAILGLEQAKTGRHFQFRVRGVDHFLTRVEAALAGEYREVQLESIPEPLRREWFSPGQGDARHLLRAGTELRRHIEFDKADFQKGQVFFAQPAHLIVLNQGIEYVNDDKKAQVLNTVVQNLAPGGALVLPHAVKRELLPEGMRRTGTSVFRRA